MNEHASYRLVDSTEELVLIEDIGPHDQFPTITNDAEWVVFRLAPMLEGRRLEYIDSDGNRDQLIVKDGKFAGFAPCP